MGPDYSIWRAPGERPCGVCGTLGRRRRPDILLRQTGGMIGEPRYLAIGAGLIGGSVHVGQLLRPGGGVGAHAPENTGEITRAARRIDGAGMARRRQ